MLAEQSLLVAIPQVQTVQQQIQDRLRKLPRSSGQDLQQIPAAPDRMRQAGLVKSLPKTVPGPGSVMHQKASVIGPSTAAASAKPRCGSIRYTVTDSLPITRQFCNRPPTRQPVSSSPSNGLCRSEAVN